VKLIHLNNNISVNFHSLPFFTILTNFSDLFQAQVAGDTIKVGKNQEKPRSS